MLIDIKRKAELGHNDRLKIQNLRRHWHLRPLLQNGQVCLAEILFGVLVGH